MVMYPNVLKLRFIVVSRRRKELNQVITYIMRAKGRPGWMYPYTNSVSTLRPICVLVIAWMMPMGRANPKDMITAKRNAHQVRLVGYPSTVTKPRPSI